MPKISVIVPVYNVEPYLSRCIDSILAQTFSDFELLLIDDGSSDTSGAICDVYLQKDPRITVIHKPNDGVSSARNTGIKFSQGKYISFIDSDDWVESIYLGMYLNPETDLTFSGHSTYDDLGNYLSSFEYAFRQFESKEKMDYTYICDKLFPPVGRLFRRNIIVENGVEYPVGITWGEDGVFGSEYMKYVNSACALSNNVYHYIVHKTQSSLASKVRPDIIDMITLSREKYLQNILSLTNDDTEQIEKIITDDIRNNCSFFVKKAFENRIKNKDKLALLERFYKNKYVQETIEHKEKYYCDNVRRAINSSPRKSLFIYALYAKRSACKKRLYKVYLKLPSSIKNQYQNLKRRVKRI